MCFGAGSCNGPPPRPEKDAERSNRIPHPMVPVECKRISPHNGAPPRPDKGPARGNTIPRFPDRTEVPGTKTQRGVWPPVRTIRHKMISVHRGYAVWPTAGSAMVVYEHCPGR